MIKYYHKYLLLLIIIFAVGVKGQDLGLVLPDIEEYQLNNGEIQLIETWDMDDDGTSDGCQIITLTPASPPGS